jgi:REP element-mobilizing transposase RayT
MSRGDRREPVFLEDADRRLFLSTLGEACAKTDWQVHAWCLMDNHFHLVVETPQANLAAGMKWLWGTYTARFNRQHRLFGHLFSGRYKSLPVDHSGNDYLRELLRQASQQMGAHHYGEERRESAEDKAARLVAAGLKAAGWKESDLAMRRKGDPVKLDLARRLRRETTLPLKWICDRLEMGSWKSINQRLYEQRQANVEM